MTEKKLTVEYIEKMLQITRDRFAGEAEIVMTESNIAAYCDNVEFLIKHIRKLEKRLAAKAK